MSTTGGTDEQAFVQDDIRAIRQELAYMRRQLSIIGAMVQNLADLATHEPDEDDTPYPHPAVRAALARADASSAPLVPLSVAILQEEE